MNWSDEIRRMLYLIYRTFLLSLFYLLFFLFHVKMYTHTKFLKFSLSLFSFSCSIFLFVSLSIYLYLSLSISISTSNFLRLTLPFTVAVQACASSKLALLVVQPAVQDCRLGPFPIDTIQKKTSSTRQVWNCCSNLIIVRFFLFLSPPRLLIDSTVLLDADMKLKSEYTFPWVSLGDLRWASFVSSERNPSKMLVHLDPSCLYF